MNKKNRYQGFSLVFCYCFSPWLSGKKVYGWFCKQKINLKLIHMKQVKLTYEMLCWDRLLSLVGNNYQESHFRNTLRGHLDWILKGLNDKSIEIIDLDEITLQDFKAFLKNYPIKRVINFDSSLYYHPQDAVPNYCTLFERNSRYSKLVGILSAMFTQVKQDGRLSQMTQNRQIAHLEFWLYNLTFPGMLDNWLKRLGKFSEEKLKIFLLSIGEGFHSIIPLLNVLKNQGVKVPVVAEQVRIFEFFIQFTKLLGSTRTRRVLEEKFQLSPQQSLLLKRLLLKRKTFKKLLFHAQVRDAFTELFRQVLVTD